MISYKVMTRTVQATVTIPSWVVRAMTGLMTTRQATIISTAEMVPTIFQLRVVTAPASEMTPFPVAQATIHFTHNIVPTETPLSEHC